MTTLMKTSNLTNRIIPFSAEPVSLLCEWESCTVVEKNIETFVNHLAIDHLPTLNETDLHCHWKDCEGFTENLTELRRHILLHGFHTKLKCYGANYQNRKYLAQCCASNQSRNIVPELLDPLICGWDDCFVLYECPEHFYRHADLHAEYDSQKEDYFECLWQDCNLRFTSKHHVKDHLRSHTQEKLIACPTCGGMFASRTKFADHIQRQLPVCSDEEDGVYECEFCGKRMKTERLLRDHMRHHVNHYKCPYCDMTCPTPSDLKLHIGYRHSEDKPHLCPYCDYRCKSENDLRKHLESHRLVPSHKCPVENCPYATRSPSCFKAHYRKVHEKKPPAKYSCHVCEKTFSRGNYLTKHLVSLHKFRWPSGHCRFRYCLSEDGIFRLQTVRYESEELSEAMMKESSENLDDPDPVITTANQQNNASNIATEELLKLSTVQYRSSDLSEATLGENSESIDDPSPIINQNISPNNITNANAKASFDSATNESFPNLNNDTYQSLNISTPKNPVVICVKDRDGIAYDTNCIVAPNDIKASEEPVLISIIDIGDSNTCLYDNQTVYLMNSSFEGISSMPSLNLTSDTGIVYEAEVIPKCD